MATYTEYPDGRKTAVSLMAAASAPAMTTLEATFEATKLAVVAEDVVELLRIPAGTYVHKVFMHVISAEDGTINVGDGAEPDGYVAAGDTSVAGSRAVGGGALATGKFYAADDTIDLSVPVAGEFSGLKVRIVASVTTIG